MALRATKLNEDAPPPRRVRASALPPGLESLLRGESILPGANFSLSPSFTDSVFRERESAEGTGRWTDGLLACLPRKD